MRIRCRSSASLWRSRCHDAAAPRRPIHNSLGLGRRAAARPSSDLASHDSWLARLRAEPAAEWAASRQPAWHRIARPRCGPDAGPPPCCGTSCTGLIDLMREQRSLAAVIHWPVAHAAGQHTLGPATLLYSRALACSHSCMGRLID